MRTASNVPQRFPEHLWSEMPLSELSGAVLRLAVPVSALERLANAGAGSRSRAASAPQCPPALLVRLARDPNASVACAALTNPGCPVEALLVYATTRRWWARAAVARNPAIPEAVLCRLGHDQIAPVRAAAASNPAAPEELLVALASPPSGYASVVRAAALNERCPPELLVELAARPDVRLRRAVARNRACPPELIAQLWAGALAALDEELKCAVAANESCPPSLLSGVAADVVSWREPNLLGDLAANRACPPAAIAALLDDADEMVRSVVIRNATCPPERLAGVALAELPRGEDLWLVATVLEHMIGDSPGVWEAAATLWSAGFDATPAELVAQAATVAA